MSLRDFSDREMDLIQHTIDAVRNLIINPVSRKRGEDSYEADAIYVAKVPSGGIPALSGGQSTGTGTGTDDRYTPGSAVCQIHKISFNASFTPTLLPIHNFNKTVYNLSLTAIVQADTPFALVERDAFGNWFASTGGGGGSTCDAQNCIIDISIGGNPGSGTFDAEFTVNSVTSTLTFNYDDTAAEVETELETHTQIASGDVNVTAGPFPNSTVRIEFQGNRANTDIELPTIDWSNLDTNVSTGTGSVQDLTGVIVIAHKAQLGVSA